MEPFRNNEEFFELFYAGSGWMCLTAAVALTDDSVILSNVDYKPMHTRALRVPVRDTFNLLTRLLAQADSQGYTYLVLDGVRTTGRNPHRAVHYVRRKR